MRALAQGSPTSHGRSRPLLPLPPGAMASVAEFLGVGWNHPHARLHRWRPDVSLARGGGRARDPDSNAVQALGTPRLLAALAGCQARGRGLVSIISLFHC